MELTHRTEIMLQKYNTCHLHIVNIYTSGFGNEILDVDRKQSFKQRGFQGHFWLANRY